MWEYNEFWNKCSGESVRVCRYLSHPPVGVVVLDTRTKGADSDVYSPLLLHRINISANSLNILSAILENNIRIV